MAMTICAESTATVYTRAPSGSPAVIVMLDILGVLVGSTAVLRCVLRTRAFTAARAQYLETRRLEMMGFRARASLDLAEPRVRTMCVSLQMMRVACTAPASQRPWDRTTASADRDGKARVVTRISMSACRLLRSAAPGSARTQMGASTASATTNILERPASSITAIMMGLSARMAACYRGARTRICRRLGTVRVRPGTRASSVKRARAAGEAEEGVAS